MERIFLGFQNLFLRCLLYLKCLVCSTWLSFLGSLDGTVAYLATAIAVSASSLKKAASAVPVKKASLLGF